MTKGMESLRLGKIEKDRQMEKGKTEMDGFGFIGGEKSREKKKMVKVCSVLAWTAMLLMWAALAASSVGVMG